MSDQINMLETNPVVEILTVTPETNSPTRQFALPRALQSRAMAEHIVRVREHIMHAQNDAELSALLLARGLDSAQLAQGLELQSAAATAYDARQQLMGAQQAAYLALAEATRQARQDFYEFRALARLALKDSAARTALGLAGSQPDDMEQFMAQARATYTAVLETPTYLDALTDYAFPQTRLETLLDELDALYGLIASANQAKSQALRATQTRNTAVAALDEWYLRFKAIVRYATRARPELRARVTR